MAVAGLFAGIGGFERAFEQAGFEANLLVEIDPAARAVLGARFPDAVSAEDVRELTDLPSDTTIVTAGFPCQNLSMAGDKSGISGDKSGVAEKMFELIERSDVSTVVIENVYFMLQLDSGGGMRWLADRFEELGYKWAYRVLDTMGFGLPQRRRRVYIVAMRETDPRGVLFADDLPVSSPPRPSLDKPLGFYWTEGRSGVGFTVDGIPPLKVGSGVGIPSAPAVLFPDGAVLTPDIEACERLQGFSEGWTFVEGDESPGRGHRWRLVGNAVSVPVARWVAQRLKEPGDPLSFEETEIPNNKSWPDAGWNVGDGRVGVVASDKPIAVDRASISAFRDSPWKALSDRALDGFIGRAKEGGLTMPEGFLSALERADRKVSNAA